MKKKLHALLISLCFAAAPQCLHAQVLDEINVVSEGRDLLVQVRFEFPVQLRRTVISQSRDLVQVFYDQRRQGDKLLDERDTSTRNVSIGGGVPDFVLIDESNPRERNRRLIMRLEGVADVTARSGKGNQTIEFVIKGKGAALKTGAIAIKQAGSTSSSPTPVTAPQVSAANAQTTTSAIVSGNPEVQAKQLYKIAKAAYDVQNYPAAIDALNELLNLPPNGMSKDAQELLGMSRLRSGEVDRARAEFKAYLSLYPTGEGADRIKREMSGLPQSVEPVAEGIKPKRVAESTISGSTSLYYFGGNGLTRTQDFKDSAIGKLPVTPGESNLSTDKFRQLFTDVDLNWRQRDDERDVRVVFRDSYIKDLQDARRNRNRLSAAYIDYKSLVNGISTRVGRQSPAGGGVAGRFDGITASYAFKPKWKVGVVAGTPTEQLFDSNRVFYGVSLDTDALSQNLGGGVYAIQQTIDGYVDRRALGVELRYFKGGASLFSQFDHDTSIKALNTAMIQGTFIQEDNTVYNVLYDRRALTLLSLGNALTFEDANNPGFVTRIQDKLSTASIDVLRRQIRETTPYVTQALLGVTKPVTEKWQVGSNVQLTNIGAIPPVAGVVGFEQGRPATGNLYTIGAQLIGLNLYSSRDTHVFSTSYITSPLLDGYLMSYNNSSYISKSWQVEPSLQYYSDRNPQGGHSRRVTPGMRVTFRNWERLALEAQISYELGRSTRVDTVAATSSEETSRRFNFSVGARCEF